MARYSDDFRASAVLMLQAAGYPGKTGALAAVSRRLGVPSSTLSRWYKRSSNPPPSKTVREKKIDLVTAIRDEVAAILGEMPDARSDADYKVLATALGILVDKLQLLTGGPTERTDGNVIVKVEYTDADGVGMSRPDWWEGDSRPDVVQ